MPIYSYRCEHCGLQFDRYQRFSDQPLSRCPECGKKALKKVYAPVGVVFKGSGFYSTDHHSPSGQTPRALNKSDDAVNEKKEADTSEK